MKSIITVIICLFSIGIIETYAFEKDIIKTSGGDLAITFVGHGTLMMEFNGSVIHIDPVGTYADYSEMPNADLILITHEHGDHLDLNAINEVTKETTKVVLTEKCAEQFEGGEIMKNGDSGNFAGFKIEAVPAYNIEHVRSEGNPYHPKGQGNGYIIYFADKKIYVAGDTENIPEMDALTDIEVAFLPMNLPYTMDPEMVAEAAKKIKPKILYPYHFGNTDTNILVELMKDQNDTEVRIRKLE